MTEFQRPEFGEPLAPAHPSAEMVRALRLRRSTSPDLMAEPGPDAGALSVMLEIAARIPDHRKVYPFRFIVFEGAGRERAGDILAAAFEREEPGAGSSRIEAERRRFSRAPVVVCVVSKVEKNHKTPEWEQVLTAGAVCYNLLAAAGAHGFASCWLTEWCAYNREALTAFGIGADERVAGFVYIGSAREHPKERQRPSLGDLVLHFGK